MVISDVHREAVEMLAKREKQLLEYISRGLTCDAAAKQMGVKPSTAQSYRHRLYRKLNVGSAAEAAVIAAKAGVV